jgi:hypothetical protein
MDGTFDNWVLPGSETVRALIASLAKNKRQSSNGAKMSAESRTAAEQPDARHGGSMCMQPSRGCLMPARMSMAFDMTGTLAQQEARTEFIVTEAHKLDLQLPLLAAQPPHHNPSARRYLFIKQASSHPTRSPCP